MSSAENKQLLANGLSDLIGYLPKSTTHRDKMMIENAYYWGAFVFTSILESIADARMSWQEAGDILDNINQEIDAYRERADNIIARRSTNVSMH